MRLSSRTRRARGGHSREFLFVEDAARGNPQAASASDRAIPPESWNRSGDHHRIACGDSLPRVEGFNGDVVWGHDDEGAPRVCMDISRM